MLQTASALCLIFLLTMSTGLDGADARGVKRVLILHSFGRDFAPFSAVSSGFRTELARQSAAPIEFLEASLVSARFTEGEMETPFVEYLRALFAQRPADLLVPFGAPAMDFLLRHRNVLFPGVPLLVGTVDRRRLKGVNLGGNATAVGVNLDLPGVIENILRLLPGTTDIEVVIGNSPLERFWLAQLRRDFKPFTNRVRFNWLNEFSFEEMRRRLATLRRDSAVLYAVLLVDAAGVPHEQERALEVLRRESNASIFGAFDSQLGRGIVGGPLYPVQQVSREAARLAVRILNGESASSIQPVLLGPGTPVYDWRELKRWKISQSRLPAGSIVRFREPTIWERYKIGILGAIGLFILQASLMFVMFVERKRRRSAQENLDERLRFEELVSQLSARFVHLPSQLIDDQIVDSLREVAQVLGFDFSSLSVFTGPAVGRVAFIWQAAGTPAIPSNLTEKDFPWMARQLFAGRDVSFLAPGELPVEAEIDRATVERIQNRSVHCVPLLAGETPVGVLNVGTFNREQGIAPGLLRRLRLLGEIFANALARKKTEQSLREEQERLRLAASAANLGLWTWDVARDEVWVTPEGRSFFGWEKSETINLARFIDTLHPDDREPTRCAISQSLDRGDDYTAEYRIVAHDGAIRWIAARGRVESDGNGNPLRMRGVAIDITERKQSEEALRESEERFRNMADSAPVMIWMSGTDRLCSYFNKVWLDFTGRTMEQELGNGWAQGVHREDFDRCLEVYVNSFDARREFTMEYRLRRYDGEYCWVLDNGVPRFEPDGTFLGYIGSCIDITQRKQAEERLRLVVEAAPNGMIMVNPEGTIILVNAQAETVFGYKRQELVGQPIELLVPARLRPRHPGYRNDFFGDPKARTMGAGRELFGLRKDGSEVAVEIGLTPIHMQEGLVVLASIIDIAERKRAAEALRQSEEHYRTLAETATDVILTIDQDSTILFVNAAAEEVFGYTPTEVVGQKITVLMPEALRQRHEEGMRRYLKTGEKLLTWGAVSFPGLHKSGREISLEIAFAESRVSDRRVFTGIIRDITERKRAESELRQRGEQLAHVTRISTMGELAASLAHELNQPLTAILSNAQAAHRFLAANPVNIDEVREILTDIVQDNSRAGEIIRRIRALVKKEELEFEPLDLASVFGDVVMLVHSDAVVRDIRVVLEFSPGLPMVRGDRIQLQQVALNLLLNAFEAMKDCPASQREVSARAHLNGAGMVEVAVRDDGSGLSGDKLDKIFQPFYTTKREGLGMGLSICRSIVEAHGGRLWAKNNKGRGATFYFTVPAEEEGRG